MLPSGAESGTIAPAGPTPFDVVTRLEMAQPTTKSYLLARCRGLEREALGDPPAAAAVLLQDSRHLSEATLDVYARLARAGTDVTMFGRGLRAWLAPGVRGVALDEDDPLGDVWAVVLVSPARPVVLAALDLFTDGRTEAERPFQVAVSRDPGVVEECARGLGLPVPSGSPARAPGSDERGPGSTVSGVAGPGTPSA